MEKNYSAFLEKGILDFLQYAGDRESVIPGVLKTVFETILKAEQQGFLGYGHGERGEKETTNKRNGFTSASVKGISKMFRIEVPRDRLGLFKPVFLDILRDENEKMNDLAFELYVKGLSNEEVSTIIHKIYDKQLSRSRISQITREYETLRVDWQNRRLEEEYYCVYSDAIYLSTRRGGSVSKEAYYVIL
ncbi:transposase Mu, partial [Candidatus Omnitrophus magneticus]